MKKDIVIYPARGPLTVPIIIQGGGTPMLDESGNQLIIMGEEGAYLNFNWDNVLYFDVHDHDCEDHANV